MSQESSNPIEKYAKRISTDNLFDKETMSNFNKKMKEVRREYRKKAALSIRDAKKTIINCLNK